MQRTLWLCLLSLLLVLPGQVRGELLNLGFADYPPHSYADSGTPYGITGIAVDVVAEALHRAGYAGDLRILPWGRAGHLVRQGVVDGIGSIYRTEERDRDLEFCTVPLYDEHIVLYTRADAHIDWSGDIGSLFGHSLGVVMGFSYGPTMNRLLAEGRFRRVQEYYSVEETLQALLDGKVEAVVSERYVALAMAERLKAGGGIVELAPELDVVPTYLALSRARNLSDAREKLDAALRTMHQDGTIDRLLETYIRTLHAGE